MAELTYTIPNDKLAEYISDYVYVHKNTETIPDPDNEGQTLPKYTDNEWVREHILRSIRGQIVRGKNAKLRDELANPNADDVT